MIFLSRKTRQILVALTLFSLLCYWPAIIATIGGGMPFRGASDAIGLFGAWRHFTSQAMSQGLLPLWNPHTFCGMPLLSNLQTSVFYPVNWLYNVLPLSFALLCDAVFHHVILLVGAYAFARALRLSRSSSLVVVLAWGLSGSVSAHSNVGHMTWHAARAFMPWLLWAALLFLRTGRQRYIAGFCVLIVLQIAAGYPPMTMLSLALCLGLWIARALSYRLRPSSQPSTQPALQQSKTHTSSTRSSENLRRLRVALPFLGLLGLVLCVWALPFIELNRASVHGTALPYSEASRLSGSWRSLLRLFFPDYFGGNYFQWSVPFSGAYEQIGYAGIYATVLALCAPWALLRRRAQRDEAVAQRDDSARRAIPWLYALLPVSIVLSLGSSLPVHRWLYDHTVLFQQLRVPGRWIELWVFAVPLLAGYANEYLVLPSLNRQADIEKADENNLACIAPESGKNSSLGVLRVAMASVFFLSCALAVVTLATSREIWVARLHYSLKESFQQITAKQVTDAVVALSLTALKSCVTAALLSAFCYLLLTVVKTRNTSFKFITPRRAYIGLLVVLALDMFNLFWDSSTPTDAREYAKLKWPQPLAQKYQSGQRWTSMGYWSDTNIHLLSDVDVLNGYDPMISKNFYAFSAAIDPDKTKKYNDWFVPRTYSPLFKVAAVTHDAWRKGGRKDEKTSTLKQPPQKIGDWYFAQHQTSWPRFYLSRNLVQTPRDRQLAVLGKLTQSDFAAQSQPVVVAPQDFQIAKFALQPQDRVLDVSRTINTLTLNVNATQPSILVAAESNFAGWRAWVNGKPTPIRDANFVFRGVQVPRGQSRVQMAYDPQTYRFALYFSLCGLMLSSAWLTSALIKRKSATKT